MIPVVTIDGPSGVGKGTIAALLAKKYCFNLLDSGAIYRVLAYAVEQSILQPNHCSVDAMHSHIATIEDDIVALAKTLDLSFDTSHTPVIATLAGQDVTNLIRTEQMGNLASKIAAIGTVRAALLSRQRDFAVLPGLVADGRDMGTAVFPDAVCKFFLSASANARAKRRFNQLREKGINASMPAILCAIEARDARDAARSASPLVPDSNAVQIDTTTLSVDDVFDQVCQIVDQHLRHITQ